MGTGSAVGGAGAVDLQRPAACEGPTPHLEIIADSEKCEPRIAQFLFMLSHDVASAEAHDLAFKPFDLWGAEFWGSGILCSLRRERMRRFWIFQTSANARRTNVTSWPQPATRRAR